MRTEQPKVIHLKDYQAPDYLIDETHLKFELFEDHSLVHAELKLRRNPERGAGLPPLLLHGQQLELLALELDGQALGADDYQLDETATRWPAVPKATAGTGRPGKTRSRSRPTCSPWSPATSGASRTASAP